MTVSLINMSSGESIEIRSNSSESLDAILRCLRNNTLDDWDIGEAMAFLEEGQTEYDLPT